VVERDPVARFVQRVFGARTGLFMFTVALGGVICIYGIPLLDGTLLPRPAPYPAYYSSLYDSNSAIVWIVLVPIAARFYLAQMTELPDLFDSLFHNGVTGLSAEEYEQFIANAQRQYQQWRWPVLAYLGFLPFWIPFCIAVTRSPDFWYYPPARWPWVLYATIQYVENGAVIAALLRYIITCRQLRVLLKVAPEHRGALLEPRFLHPDGLGGLGPILTLVQQSLMIAGGVLIVVTLETVNSSRTVIRFTEGTTLSGFIVVAVVYATVVPYVLLYPLRLALRGLRTAKRHLTATLSLHENAAIWSQMRALDTSSPEEREAHVEVVIRTLKPLGQISQALDTVPETLFELSRRSSQMLIAAAVVPPLFSIAYRVASDVWGWNLDLLLRSILTSPH
jgi:hypothetical protein